jgi:hypothetical protein
VIALSLASGALAFTVVRDHRLSRTAPPEPAATQVQPDVPPRIRPEKLPRTVAAGHQLGAAAPLRKVHQDQGSSVLLPDGRTLWIFADTFQQTKPSFFVTSSAAVTAPATWRLRYSRTTYASGSTYPTEFLPRTAKERADRRAGRHYQAVWPTGSTRLPNGSILISYAKFLGAGLFEYRYQGLSSLLAGGHARRIADDVWSRADGEVRSPIYAEGHVYFSQCAKLRCYSLRAPVQSVADPATYTWWTGSGWSPDRSRRTNMTVVTNHPGGNPSLVRLNGSVYAMADTEAGSVSTVGRLWVAPRPWGPWSRAASFTMARCPPPGCYGLNLHPEASTPNALRVSYATAGTHPVVRVDDVAVSFGAKGGWIRTRE